jgi:hypothetical protein
VTSRPRSRSRPPAPRARPGPLIDAFETPYGLELLATTHWVATREGASDPEAATGLVRAWSDRKERLFTSNHVTKAWERLDDGGWLSAVRVAVKA